MSAAISDPVSILESKMPSLRLSEREGPRPVESRQRGNARVADRKSAERFAGLAPNRQPGDAAVDDCGAEPATVGELGDQRVGNIFDRAVNQDLVVGRRG